MIVIRILFQDFELKFSIARPCRHGNLELRSGERWIKTDLFTAQDIDENLVSYAHDGSETRADSCVLQVNNAVGASEHKTLEIIIHSVDDGAPRVTINSGLNYLEYIDGEPGGVIGPSGLDVIFQNIILTPRLTRVPFRDAAILTAFFAHSCYSEIIDQKWLLSLNSIYQGTILLPMYKHIDKGLG